MGFQAIKTIPYNKDRAEQVMSPQMAKLALRIIQKEWKLDFDDTYLILNDGNYRTPLANKSLADIDQYIWNYVEPSTEGIFKRRVIYKLPGPQPVRIFV